MDRYRVYLRPGTPPGRTTPPSSGSAVSRGEASAGGALDRKAVEAVVDLALGEASPVDQDAADEFLVRFQQTCGPAMAKAIEDTAYYRYVRLVGLNEWAAIRPGWACRPRTSTSSRRTCWARGRSR